MQLMLRWFRKKIDAYVHIFIFVRVYVCGVGMCTHVWMEGIVNPWLVLAESIKQFFILFLKCFFVGLKSNHNKDLPIKRALSK